jgi:hypothetical protein
MQVIVEQHLFVIAQKANDMLDLFSEVDYGINHFLGIGAAVDIITDQHKSVPFRVNIDPGHHFIHFIGASMNIAYGKQLFQKGHPGLVLIIREKKIVSLHNLEKHLLVLRKSIRRTIFCVNEIMSGDYSERLDIRKKLP